LGEGLANVVALALSKRPETRYQTGDQFAADLRAVGTDAAQRPPLPSPLQPATTLLAEPLATGMEKTVAFTATVPYQPAPASAGQGAHGADIEI
jgi:serine/threonine-protein kinase